MTNKKIASEIAIGIVLLIVIAIGVIFWMQNRNSVISNQELVTNKVEVRKPIQKEGIMCTQEAKLCDDGSYVSRTGPRCEFAECLKKTNKYISKEGVELFKKALSDIYDKKIKYENYKNSAKPYAEDKLIDELILWSIPYKEGATYSVESLGGYRTEQMDFIVDSFYDAKDNSQILKLPSVWLGHAQGDYEARKIRLGGKEFVVYDNFGIEGGYFARVYLTLDSKTQQILVIGIGLPSVDVSEISSQEKCGPIDTNTKNISGPGCHKVDISYPEKVSEIINQIETILSQ